MQTERPVLAAPGFSRTKRTTPFKPVPALHLQNAPRSFHASNICLEFGEKRASKKRFMGKAAQICEALPEKTQDSFGVDMNCNAAKRNIRRLASARRQAAIYWPPFAVSTEPVMNPA